MLQVDEHKRIGWEELFNHPLITGAHNILTD